MQVTKVRVVVEEASSCIRSIVDRFQFSKNSLLLSLSLRPQLFFIDYIQNQHFKMSANGQTPTWREKTNECTLKRKSKYYPKKIKKRKSKGGK